MTRTIWIVACSLGLIGCSTMVAPADNASVCEALRPYMPVTYHEKADTADTVARIRRINAAFTGACPVV